ncbi:glutamate--cysteine ligase [Streptomyces phaeoluteigriseus]|uniref:Putative glutamate--cysteine ligase 2 n=1 Tax=Streptomyces phaeoluteigriseus TaxID=114686 RepID=A0ABY4Z8F8_9ACTN|nr:glutamate--cysteine ligase [Streptomyces phaeoluteigriseus]USQ85231.1 glutamate--cysteine ligase [Streptomyces phaeoluteigriseus]
MAVRIGVEEEFHVLDTESGLLVPRADAVLGRLRLRPDFTAELQRSAVEWNSGVHASLDSLHADVVKARLRLDAAASGLGLAVVAAGTVPLARLTSGDATPDPRYRRMADEYRQVADEHLVCSAQVHVDVSDRDTAVRIMCAISPWLPPLLALSASSPFWLGADTGYASWRAMLWQRWPTSGPAGCFAGADEYDATVTDLVRSGVISDPGMIYYDVRPSDHQRTLELRICDACPRAETVVLIAGLFRALVEDARARLEEPARRGAHRDGRHEWLRAAGWRAARAGLEGDLVHPVTRLAEPAPAVLRDMLRRLRPALETAGDWDTVRGLVEEALARGSAAHRLRGIVEEKGLLAGVGTLVAETRGERRPGRAPKAARRPGPALTAVRRTVAAADAAPTRVVAPDCREETADG